MSTDADRDLSRLYRAGAREEPPTWLDQAILTAADGEHAQPAMEASPGRRVRWQAPLALAAVLTLAVSLALLVEGELEQQKPTSQPLPAQIAPPPAESDPAPSAPSSAHEQRAEPVAEPIITAPPAGVPDAGEITGSARQAPREQYRMRPALPEATRERARVGSDSSKALAEPQAGASAPAPHLQAPSSAPPRIEASQEQADAVLTPQQWLREIEQLRRDGREELARIRLDQFRKRFPEYPLPESMQ